ncbi:MAG: hypothetical protein U0610_04470 [bacterium]
MRTGIEYRVTADVRVQAGFWYDPTPVPKTTVDFRHARRYAFHLQPGLHVARVPSSQPRRARAPRGLDLSTVAQLLHYPSRKFAVGQSVNLGGSKDFSTTVNDFPLELEALALSLGTPR